LIYNKIEELILNINKPEHREIAISQYIGTLTATNDPRIKTLKENIGFKNTFLSTNFALAGTGLNFAFRGETSQWVHHYRKISSSSIKEWAEHFYIRHLAYQSIGVNRELESMIQGMMPTHPLTIESAAYYYLNSGQPEKLLNLIDETLSNSSYTSQERNHFLFPAIAIAMQNNYVEISLEIYEKIKSVYGHHIEWDHFHYSVAALLAIHKGADYSRDLVLIEDSLMVMSTIPYLYDYFHLKTDNDASQLVVEYMLSFIDSYQNTFGHYAATLSLIKISNYLFII